jgi:hypothetical protein
MLRTVKLHNQSRGFAVKVAGVGGNRMLAAKLAAIQSAGTQMEP